MKLFLSLIEPQILVHDLHHTLSLLFNSLVFVQIEMKANIKMIKGKVEINFTEKKNSLIIIIIMMLIKG